MSHEFFSHVQSGRLVKALRRVDLRTAARSLSQQCRYNGTTSEFYSVAQHSVLLSEQWPAGDERAVWALLRDLHECVIGDIARPLRGKLLWKVGDGFLPTHALEDMLLGVVRDRFGLAPIPAEVLRADSLIAVDEMLCLFTDPPYSRRCRRLGVAITPLPPKEAEALFLHRAAETGLDRLFESPLTVKGR